MVRFEFSYDENTYATIMPYTKATVMEANTLLDVDVLTKSVHILLVDQLVVSHQISNPFVKVRDVAAAILLVLRLRYLNRVLAKYVWVMPISIQHVPYLV